MPQYEIQQMKERLDILQKQIDVLKEHSHKHTAHVDGEIVYPFNPDYEPDQEWLNAPLGRPEKAVGDDWKEKAHNSYKHMLEVQVTDPSSKTDPYMRGMANGMIFIDSCIRGVEPKYMGKPLLEEPRTSLLEKINVIVADIMVNGGNSEKRSTEIVNAINKHNLIRDKKTVISDADDCDFCNTKGAIGEQCKCGTKTKPVFNDDKPSEFISISRRVAEECLRQKGLVLPNELHDELKRGVER